MLALSTLTLAAALLGAAPPDPVFVDVAEARALVAEGATVLDARGSAAKAPFLPGARLVEWTDLREGRLRSGRLASPDRVRAALAARGVRADRPVLVYGAADRGWGEEGRLWWTLRYLGHPRVRILDGGVQAWLRAEGPTAAEPAPELASAPRWKGEVQVRLRADTEQVRLGPGHPNVRVIDARTREEYEGATPYLSARGGHVPGARLLSWRDLLAPDGRLKPEPELRRLLAAYGLAPGQRVIAYCTGGVRSAFLIAALAHLGFDDVANYDASWWAWSADPELPAATK